MSKIFSRDISAGYKAAYEIAKSCAEDKFGSDVTLWKGDYEIKDDWYSNRKKVMYSVKPIRIFGVCGVAVVVRVNENNIPKKTLAKFYFGFTKKVCK